MLFQEIGAYGTSLLTQLYSWAVSTIAMFARITLRVIRNAVDRCQLIMATNGQRGTWCVNQVVFIALKLFSVAGLVDSDGLVRISILHICWVLNCTYDLSFSFS